MDKQLQVFSGLNELQLADVFVKSGFFQDAADANKAVVKILAGRELGFGPIASMTGINVIKGRISPSANIMAAMIKRSGKYNYRVRKHTNDECEIEFFERNGQQWESVGFSPFSLQDAKKAGTQNLEKFPRNMLFARAISNGFRWFCADLSGAPLYTPEELGEAVNEDGDIITHERPAAFRAAIAELDKAEAEVSAPRQIQAPLTYGEALSHVSKSTFIAYGVMPIADLEKRAAAYNKDAVTRALAQKALEYRLAADVVVKGRKLSEFTIDQLTVIADGNYQSSDAARIVREYKLEQEEVAAQSGEYIVTEAE